MFVFSAWDLAMMEGKLEGSSEPANNPQSIVGRCNQTASLGKYRRNSKVNTEFSDGRNEGDGLRNNNKEAAACTRSRAQTSSSNQQGGI
jgi:hypothetical protein